jgi:hypothetical protein
MVIFDNHFNILKYFFLNLLTYIDLEHLLAIKANSLFKLHNKKRI